LFSAALALVVSSDYQNLDRHIFQAQYGGTTSRQVLPTTEKLPTTYRQITNCQPTVIQQRANSQPTVITVTILDIFLILTCTNQGQSNQNLTYTCMKKYFNTSPAWLLNVFFLIF